MLNRQSIADYVVLHWSVFQVYSMKSIASINFKRRSVFKTLQTFTLGFFFVWFFQKWFVNTVVEEWAEFQFYCCYRPYFDNLLVGSELSVKCCFKRFRGPNEMLIWVLQDIMKCDGSCPWQTGKLHVPVMKTNTKQDFWSSRIH